MDQSRRPGLLRSAARGLLVIITGCSVAVADPKPAPLEDACNGNAYSALCEGYWPGYRYGVVDACTGAPWRETDAGKIERASGRKDCARWSQGQVTCCPE